jgi:light-regulated signal transduction histidine kinase (bacteriophytochrome)
MRINIPRKGGEIIAAAEVSANHWDPDGPHQVIHFWVQDNGIGIAEEDQAKIFQKFFRSEDPKHARGDRYWAGFEHYPQPGGDARAVASGLTSEFRKGTVFHFTIPIAE